MDISKLSWGVRSAVAQRLGAEMNGIEIVMTPEIAAQMAAMTPREIAAAYTGWHLGSEDWADTIIGVYEAAQKAAE